MADSTPSRHQSRTAHPGIYKLRTGRYLVRLRTPFGDCSKSFDSLSTAKKWQRETRVALESGDRVIHEGQLLSREEAARLHRPSLTVAQAIDHFTVSGSCKVKPNLLNAVASHLGSTPLDELSKAHIVRFLDDRCQGLAPATRNRYLSAISSLCKYACQRDWLEHNPCSTVQKWSEHGNARDRVITPDEEQALQTAFDNHSPELGDIFALLMLTGCRVGEATSLRWRDVDVAKGTVRLSAANTKASQSRTLVLAGRALERLKARAKVRPINSDDLVFPNHWSPGKEVDATRRFRKVADATGHDWFHAHLCRHTFASRAASAPGMTIAKLCELCGWSSWAMAARYAHSMQDDTRDVMEQLAQRYGQ
jgi:integrase